MTQLLENIHAYMHGPVHRVYTAGITFIIYTHRAMLTMFTLLEVHLSCTYIEPRWQMCIGIKLMEVSLLCTYNYPYLYIL